MASRSFTILKPVLTRNQGESNGVGTIGLNTSITLMAPASCPTRGGKYNKRSLTTWRGKQRRPVLIHACETWKITNEISNKLQILFNRCLWKVITLRGDDFLNSGDLWKRAGFPGLNTTIYKGENGDGLASHCKNLRATYLVGRLVGIRKALVGEEGCDRSGSAQFRVNSIATQILLSRSMLRRRRYSVYLKLKIFLIYV